MINKNIALNTTSENYLNSILAIIIFLLSILLTFNPIITLGFSLPDDHWMLLKNELVHPINLNFNYLVSVFKRINAIQYSPLNTLYYHLIYLINGYDPYYYHLFNLVLHLLNAVLLYNLAQYILRVFTNYQGWFIPYIACLIWTIHPLNVEAIAWISGSKILLCTSLSLISLSLFIKGIIKKNPYILCLSLPLFILSFLCKEQAILTPFMQLTFYILYGFKKKDERHIKRITTILLIISVLISCIFAIFTLYVNNYNSVDIPASNYTIFERVVLSIYCLRFYIANLVAPINLHYSYIYPFQSGYPLPLIFILYVILFLPFIYLIINFIKQNNHLKYYLFCIIIFFIQISIELQILPMTRPAIVADRYMYLPSFFLIIYICHLINETKIKFHKIKVKYLILTIYIPYFIIYSNFLVSKWKILNLIK